MIVVSPSSPPRSRQRLRCAPRCNEPRVKGMPPILLLLFCAALLVRGAAAEDAMGSNEFMPHVEVESLLSQDEAICDAIDRAQESYAEFCRAFERREPAQVGFLVTVLRRDGPKLVPVGILVSRIDGETIEGLEMPNALVSQPGQTATCRRDQVVDWRYVDAFELRGGRLYRLLFDRQLWSVQGAIDDELPFLSLIHGQYAEKDQDFRNIFRDVANLRYAEVERKMKANPDWRDKEAFIPAPQARSRAWPKPTHGSVVEPRTTISEYAAQFADAKMMKLLYDLGALHENKGKNPPLERSVIYGNLETMRCMLELGFDVDVLNEYGKPPLDYALMWDRVDIIALLLKFGADCNRRHRSWTPLFYATSVEAAKQLIAAGARVDDAVDDKGRTCVEWHLECGKADIADLLVQHGARRDPAWRLGPTKAEAEALDREELREELRTTNPQGLAEIELGWAVDYGHVLPVRNLSIAATE